MCPLPCWNVPKTNPICWWFTKTILNLQVPVEEPCNQLEFIIFLSWFDYQLEVMPTHSVYQLSLPMGTWHSS